MGCVCLAGTEKAERAELELASINGDDMLSRLSKMRLAASLVMAGEARTNLLCTLAEADEPEAASGAEGEGDAPTETRD